jgi:nucleoside-diphosphate-sugar epimerase
VSSPRGRVRSRRKAITVAVAGAAAPVGEVILRALLSSAADSGRIGTVVALDEVRGSVDGARWRVGEMSSPEVAVSLSDVDALVHIATSTDLAADLQVGARMRRERAVRRVQTLVTAAAAAGVAHVVVVTSAMVYGASKDNPVPLPEDQPLAAEPDEGLVGDLLAVEEVLATAREVHPGLDITVVRPAALVGPGVDTVTTRHFEAPRLLTVGGCTPAWQFCHVEDLASALVSVVERGLGPVVTVAAEGTLSQERVEQVSGMRHVQLSESLALGTAQRLHRVGVLPAPATELAYALHPWAVSSAVLREAGWSAAYDNETALGVLLDGIRGHHAVAGRRVDRKDAALGAASAAVALVGTAAIMRRRRRNGGGA